MERYMLLSSTIYYIYLHKVHFLQSLAGVSIVPEDITVLHHSTYAVAVATSIVYM